MTDPSIAFLLALVGGYLIGSVPFGLLLTRAAGLGDIRGIGSGNIGATNVLRTGRKGLAVATLLLDALKGVAAVLLARWFLGDQDLVAGDQAREVRPCIAGEVRPEEPRPAHLHPVHRVRQDLSHDRPNRRATGRGNFAQRTVSTSEPESRIATVCSKWAESLPSRVTTVQPSSSTRTSGPPMLSIGSMQMAIPALSAMSWRRTSAST